MQKKMTYGLAAVAGVMIVAILYDILFKLGDEVSQGAVYRIMFFHIPAGIMGFIMYFVAMVASIGFLITKRFNYDSMAVAAVEVGTMFCSLNLITGSIWGREAWGIWWAWDARMTSQLICFLLYAGYLILRPATEDPTQRATFAAVLAIFSFADVPIVYFSIQWWRTQHPSPVLTTGGLGPGLRVPLYSMLLAYIFLGIALLLVRLQQESMSREIDSLRRQAHAM
jgi:heme exporter protein C